MGMVRSGSGYGGSTSMVWVAGLLIEISVRGAAGVVPVPVPCTSPDICCNIPPAVVPVADEKAKFRGMSVIVR